MKTLLFILVCELCWQDRNAAFAWWLRLSLRLGEEVAVVDPQASLCAPWPPGRSQKPDSKEAGQAAGLRTDRSQI